MNFQRIAIGLIVLLAAGLAGSFWMNWKTLTQLRRQRPSSRATVFADAVAACEKAQSTTPFKWNGGKKTAVIGLNSVKLNKDNIMNGACGGSRSPLRRSDAASLGPVADDPRLGRGCSPPGCRYRGPTRVWLSLAVGAVAGFLSGSVQIPGPPVLIYWLGRKVVSATMRANAIVFFMFTTVIAGIGFLYGGIFTAEVMAKSAALFPGLRRRNIRRRPHSSAAPARRRIGGIAYATILAAAVISMPVLDDGVIPSPPSYAALSCPSVASSTS